MGPSPRPRQPRRHVVDGTLELAALGAEALPLGFVVDRRPGPFVYTVTADAQWGLTERIGPRAQAAFAEPERVHLPGAILTATRRLIPDAADDQEPPSDDGNVYLELSANRWLMSVDGEGFLRAVDWSADGVYGFRVCNPDWHVTERTQPHHGKEYKTHPERTHAHGFHVAGMRRVRALPDGDWALHLADSDTWLMESLEVRVPCPRRKKVKTMGGPPVLPRVCVWCVCVNIGTRFFFHTSFHSFFFFFLSKLSSPQWKHTMRGPTGLWKAMEARSP